MIIKNILLGCVFLLFILSLAGCGGEGGNANANRTANLAEETPAPVNTASPTPPPASPLEKELYYIKGSNFRQVLVFARKDKGDLTTADVDFFKEYAPVEQINQRLKSGDNKYLIAGTNFAFTPEQRAALEKRFTIEDYTERYGRPRDAANTNANVNANGNSSPTPAKTN